MIVMAIDPGSYKAGYCILMEKRYKLGVITLAKDQEREYRLLALSMEIERLVGVYGPDHFGVEAPWIPRVRMGATGVKEGGSVQSAMKVAGVRDVCVVGIRRRSSKPIHEIQPTTAKKALTRDGRSKKPRMVQAAVNLINQKVSEDEADALGIALATWHRASKNIWPGERKAIFR